MKEFTSLGLMSGTSGDGVDASIIISDGNSKYEVIKDKYYEYDNEIYHNFHDLRQKINSKEDLKLQAKYLNNLERKITLFHAKVIEDIAKTNKFELVGFHGQTIFHSSTDKLSKQLGDGLLLSQLAKKDLVFNFRSNDILNGGEGAPLTPIFHQLILKQIKLNLPACILNIGGISNISIIHDNNKFDNIFSKDIGPGNCLIDSWVRQNSDQKYDNDGSLASAGNKNEIIFEQIQELFSNRVNQNSISLDTNDFDVSFARGLSLEDGAATLTDFTARVIGTSLTSLTSKENKPTIKVLICGGGRKNKILMKKIKENVSNKIEIEPIDKYGINGDYIESQAFAYLAIRSILELPISFPKTTGCSRPLTGGKIIKF